MREATDKAGGGSGKAEGGGGWKKQGRKVAEWARWAGGKGLPEAEEERGLRSIRELARF